MPLSAQNKQGLIEAYLHSNGRVGVLIELFCQTDFASRTPEFKELAHNLAMQVAAMGKKDLLKQSYIRNPEITVKDLIQQVKETLGEEIKLGRVVRYRLL